MRMRGGCSPVLTLSPSAISGNRAERSGPASPFGLPASPSAGTGRRWRAPSPLDDSSDDDQLPARTASFALQAPSGLSDSDGSDEDGEVHSRRRPLGRMPSFTAVRPPGPTEVALAEVTAQLDHAFQINVQRRVAEFQKALVDIETQEHAALAAAGRDRQRKQQALAATAAERQAEQAQGRRQLMRSLRSEHEAKAAQAQQRVTELEITARQARERHQAAADAARKAAAAAAAQQEAQKEREAEEQAATQAAAAKQQQAQAQQEERAKASAAASLVPGILSISPGAAEFRQQCAQRLEAAQAAVRPFVEDRAMRDAKRSIDKFVTLNVQQISATLDQVRAKAQALASFVGQQQGVHRTYSLLTLAGKLLSQCEVQITRLHSFAFPLAEVAVAVGAAHGEFLDLLLARLHRACPLAVPCSYGYRPGTDEDEYLRLAGYKVTQEEGRVVKESTDEYVARMQGYVMLYAAITQSDNPANPHGLPHAWAYAARLLNALPATRVTAAALDAFLKVAGYKMAASYRGQFTKLLAAVDRHFLGELSASADPDARAVYTRLQTYLRTLAFNKAPEGRNMPRHDSSSYDRA